MSTLSLKAKRLAKSTALGLALATHSNLSPSLTRRVLTVARVGYDPPRHLVTYPGGATSACCISIDFDATVPERELPNRQGTESLVALGERYRIPMTWAICGRTAENDRRAYDMIASAPVRHEIGVHTYSHIDVSKCSEAELEQEIEKCIEVLALSERPKTFIFPWNRTGHFDAVKKLGFIAYRAKERTIGYPRKANGLWNIAPVFYLDKNALGAAGLIRRTIDFCIDSGSVFHLWLHPWSVVDPSPDEYSRQVLEPTFSYMEKKRSEGKLSVLTMRSLAEWLETMPGDGA